MEATEFRIGNIIEYWIDTDNLGWQICRLDHQDLKRLSEQPDSFKHEHRFVELTEEILLKCGFDKLNNKFMFDNLRWHIEKPCNYDGFLFCEGFKVLTEKIKYLHQLQNLYFALTNEELEINL
jgi:hypothetical protein